MIRVVVVDDHPLVREALRMILSIVGDIEVVGEAKDGIEALAALQRLRPDVIVMDITMPRLNGFEALDRMRRQAPGVRVIFVTAHAEEEYERAGRQAGVHAFVRKEAAGRELVPAVYGAASGLPNQPWAG